MMKKKKKKRGTKKKSRALTNFHASVEILACLIYAKWFQLRCIRLNDVSRSTERQRMLRSNRITSSPVNLHPRMHLRPLATLRMSQINSSSTETSRYIFRTPAHRALRRRLERDHWWLAEKMEPYKEIRGRTRCRFRQRLIREQRNFMLSFRASHLRFSNLGERPREKNRGRQKEE